MNLNKLYKYLHIYFTALIENQRIAYYLNRVDVCMHEHGYDLECLDLK